MKKSPIKYQEGEVEDVFQKLISNWGELIKFYNTKVKFDYTNPKDRLAYLDIAEIAKFVLDKKKAEQTENFETFFENVEAILMDCDTYVKNLVVVGLFEGIQNVDSSKVGYYRSFDQWLKLNSLKEWRNSIDFWEGNSWKKTPESEKILNKE